MALNITHYGAPRPPLTEDSTISYYSQMGYTILLVWTLILPWAGGRAQPASQVKAGQSERLRSAERSFTITLHADPERAVRAFGPVEEKRWSPEWNPEFIFIAGYPSDPDSAVFRITHGMTESIWTLSNHDRQRGSLQYVVFNPGKMLTVIEIHCVSSGRNITRATVTYRKTALVAESNAEVDHFAEHFTEEREHWEQTIDGYLHGDK